MKSIIDWKWPWLQVLILAFVLTVPFIFDFAQIIDRIFYSSDVDFSNVKFYYLMRLGNGVIGIVLMILALLPLRRYNSRYLLNTGMLYHNHLYSSYWFCSKILGYEKCSLVRVPITMQFKLVIRDTFSEYDYGEENDYKCIDVEDIIIEAPANDYTSTVNLVLADTYPITAKQLPESISNFSFIYILRDNKSNYARCYSGTFCDSVLNTVRHLPNNVRGVNLFSTLNPKHSYWIAKNVFKMGGRSNIKNLWVFSQPYKNGSWNFAKSGIKIF